MQETLEENTKYMSDLVVFGTCNILHHSFIHNLIAMKKFIVYILGIITALSVAYAGLDAIDSLITQRLTVSTLAHF